MRGSSVSFALPFDSLGFPFFIPELTTLTVPFSLSVYSALLWEMPRSNLWSKRAISYHSPRYLSSLRSPDTELSTVRGALQLKNVKMAAMKMARCFIVVKLLLVILFIPLSELSKSLSQSNLGSEAKVYLEIHCIYICRRNIDRPHRH